MSTPSNTVAHTHIRATMYDQWLKHTRYEHKWVDRNRTPEDFIAELNRDLAKHFVIVWTNTEMGRDLEGDTVYYKIKYKFNDTTDRLTVHVFSDYCSDFVEGDKPPF